MLPFGFKDELAVLKRISGSDGNTWHVTVSGYWTLIGHGMNGIVCNSPEVWHTPEKFTSRFKGISKRPMTISRAKPLPQVPVHAHMKARDGNFGTVPELHTFSPHPAPNTQ